MKTIYEAFPGSKSSEKSKMIRIYHKLILRHKPLYLKELSYPSELVMDAQKTLKTISICSVEGEVV